MDIKKSDIVSVKSGNVGWVEKHFIFETGQKATWHTHTHTIKCYNGIGRDITETEIGKKMIEAVRKDLDNL
jgi:hypothetical protein